MSVKIESNVKDPDRIRERREQIISAAVQLFSRKGFHKTTTREIAKQSGLSNGALYEYVKTKEDVLFLVCQYIHDEILRRLKQKLPGSASGASRLRLAIIVFMEVMADMQDEVLLIYQESKSLPDAYLHEVLRKEQEITAVFERLLRAGVNDLSLAIHPENIPLCAHNIIVTGQMWAFRRWALTDVEFTQFVTQQVQMLMQASGASPTES